MTARLALGTAQFGMDYGITNTVGRVPVETVADILEEARIRGISMLDTAALYGASEEALGQQNLEGFELVTKTPRFATAEIVSEQVDELIQAFRHSQQRLHRRSLYGLLSHHVDDLLAPGGERLWDAMQELRDAGDVERIGASVYEGWQIDAFLDRFSPELIQVPVNVLDQRLVNGHYIDMMKDRGIEVHARSVFLQGLLLMQPENTPDYFVPMRPLLHRYRDAAIEQGLTPTQAALAYVRDLPGIDMVIVGVTNRAQLCQCAEDFAQTGHFAGTGLACDEPSFVNPALWRLT